MSLERCIAYKFFRVLFCAFLAMLIPNLDRDVQGTGEEGLRQGKAGCCSKVGACSALWVWMLGSWVYVRFSGSTHSSSTKKCFCCWILLSGWKCFTSEWQWEFRFAAASSGFLVPILSVCTVVRWCPVVGSVWPTWWNPIYCVLPLLTLPWCQWPGSALGWLLQCNKPFLTQILQLRQWVE